MSNLEQIISGKSVVVIDDDELMLQLVKTYCLDMGFDEVATFVNAEKAVKFMMAREKPFDYIITDWQMPGIGGVGFFNKVRTDLRYHKTPVMVISGFIDRSDFALLDDYPVTTLLEKPFTKSLIERKLVQLINESFWLEKNFGIIKGILKEFKNDAKKATKQILESLKEAPDPVSFGIHLAKNLRENGHMQSAKTLITWVLKKSPKSVMAMTECARIFKETGNLREALELLDIANNVSPQNIERLCLTGEVNLELHQPLQAKEIFSKALVIDRDNTVARAGNSISDNLNEHLMTHDPYNLPNSFAGVLNLLAIEKVKKGEFDEGMNQYESALVFVKDPTTVSKLKFNRGLGYLRWGKKDEALAEFKESVSVTGSKFSKSADYIEKLQRVIEEDPDLSSFGGSDRSEAAFLEQGDQALDTLFDDSFDLGDFGTKSADDLSNEHGVDLNSVLRDEEGGAMAEDIML